MKLSLKTGGKPMDPFFPVSMQWDESDTYQLCVTLREGILWQGCGPNRALIQEPGNSAVGWRHPCNSLEQITL